MGAGREGGTPSSPMASPSKQATSMLLHKLQKDELLDGGNNAPTIYPLRKQKPTSTTRIRTPRAGNTPVQSPRSISPPGLSSTEVVSSEIASATLVDFQEAILRASHGQKTMSVVENYSFHEEAMDLQMQKVPFSRPSKPTNGEENEAPSGVAVAATRSKLDVQHTQGLQQPRHKSPLPPGRLRALDDRDQEAALATHSTKKESTMQPSEWVLLGRGKSPRRSKVLSSSVAVREESQELPDERKPSRSSSRRSKVVESPEDPPDADLGMGDASRASRRTHSRPHTRQHKRKASESITVTARPTSPPESHARHQSPSLHQRQQVVPEYHQPPHRVERTAMATSSPPTSSFRREARTIATSDWIQFIGDIVMWRHIPRSSLLFGAGCFCIMSASLVQDMRHSMISILAYIALFYLAARFIKCNFLRGSSQTIYVSSLTEADVLRLIRVVLPPFNVMLQKIGDLFSGDPMVTLKVAGALWFLARAGSTMNMWTLTRIAFFALFTVPKFYSCYNEQIKAQARNIFYWMRTTWSACGHKKAVMFTGFIIAWNFSSVSTRFCGAFLVLVGVRAYQHVIRSEVDIGSSFLNQERPATMSH